MLWTHLQSDEFQAAVEECRRVCVIPVGCIEAHGTHMPLGCDSIAGAAYAQRAAEIEPVCVFPEMYFGEKSGAGEYPGTIIFPTPLIWQILEQTCNEIARNGFEKILLYNSHGGNKSMLDSFARYILQKKPEYSVYTCYKGLVKVSEMLEELEKYPYLTEGDVAILKDYAEKKKKDGHGGFCETGALYDVCPELISLEKWKEVDGTSRHLFDGFTENQVYTPFGWMGDYPNSLSCDYHEGLNERIARAMGQKTVEKSAAIFKFLREETVSRPYHKAWLAKQK